MEEEKGYICWGRDIYVDGKGKKEKTKEHDEVFNILSTLLLLGISSVVMKQAALSWSRQGWNTALRLPPEGLLTPQPDFCLFSISMGALRIFWYWSHYCASSKDFHKHKYGLYSASKQKDCVCPPSFFFFSSQEKHRRRYYYPGRSLLEARSLLSLPSLYPSRDADLKLLSTEIQWHEEVVQHHAGITVSWK